MNTYIIAEIGINHDGKYDQAIQLIDMAVDSGCNCAKFQFFSASNLYPKDAGMLDWTDGSKKYEYDIYQAVENFELPIEWIKPLMEYCHKVNIDFMASVFDIDGLNILLDKGLKLIKIPSYCITNIPLVRAVAKTKLPVFMSTGGASLGETEEAVNSFLKIHNDLTLLHCSIQYPTILSNINLGILDTFKYAFPSLRYGLSDHSAEVSQAPVQAVFLGASVIEKHITLNKTLPGPDHFFALEPKELVQMTSEIKLAEKKLEQGEFLIDPMIYGSSEKICHDHEKYLRTFGYMSIFAKKDIQAGNLISEEDILILRPGKKQPGLAPKYLDLFSQYLITARTDILKGDAITWDSIFQ